MAALRLLTLTSLFPNSLKPRHGIFVANRLRRLCDTGRVEATVVAAVPWFPGAYRDTARVPATEHVHGFDVAHPRYLNVPGFGMRLQPDQLARSLLRHLRQAAGRRYDVVDAHYFYPDGVAAVQVADALDLPLVISARGSDINLIAEDPSARARMLHAAQRAQALIAVSGALKARMEEIGMPAGGISVLRNGVDASMFAPSSRAEARQRLHIDARAALVLGVGNLVPEKGFDLLVRAVALVPGARALIIGEGRAEREIRELADALAPGRVEVRGSVPQAELRYAYAAADVLALPSVREGWPNVVLEALACGTPVVAAAVGGVPEMMQSASAGAIVSSRTPETWAAALRRQLQEPPSPQAVRAHATAFGWDEIVMRQCDLYEDIASRWRATVRPLQAEAVSHA